MKIDIIDLHQRSYDNISDTKLNNLAFSFIFIAIFSLAIFVWGLIQQVLGAEQNRLSQLVFLALFCSVIYPINLCMTNWYFNATKHTVCVSSVLTPLFTLKKYLQSIIYITGATAIRVAFLLLLFMPIASVWSISQMIASMTEPIAQIINLVLTLSVITMLTMAILLYCYALFAFWLSDYVFLARQKSNPITCVRLAFIQVKGLRLYILRYVATLIPAMVSCLLFFPLLVSFPYIKMSMAYLARYTLERSSVISREDYV